MKGLILKDFYIVKTYLLLFLVISIIISCFLNMVVPDSIANGILTAIFPLIMIGYITTTISYDTACNWHKTAIYLPIEKNKIILSKYVFSVVICLGACAVGLAESFLLTSIQGTAPVMEYTINFLVWGLCFSFISIGITIPFSMVIRSGVEILNVVVILGAWILSYVLLSAFNLSFDSLDATLNLLMLLTAIFVMIISYFITTKLAYIKNLFSRIPFFKF